MKDKKLDVHNVPRLLTGQKSSRLEPNGRLYIPAPWKDEFRSSRAFTLSSKMGRISYQLLYPEVNFRWLLGASDPGVVRSLLRSAEEHDVDSQARVVLPRDSSTFPNPVSLVGAGACLQILPIQVAEMMRAKDETTLEGIFGVSPSA